MFQNTIVKKTRFWQRACSALLAVLIAFTVELPISAQDAAPLASPQPTLSASAGDEALNDMMAMDRIAPAGLATAQNPYGYDVGVPFTLSVGHELMYYGGWNGSTERKILNADNIDALKSFVNAPNKGTASSARVPDGVWNWVQAVSFKSNAQLARKDMVLFVGLKQSDSCAYAWVLNYNSGAVSAPLNLGNMGWIDEDYDQYSSTSLFDVAAGDFNGDGVDTLLVYTPLSLNSTDKNGCTLYELSYNGSALTKTGTVNHLLMDQYVADQNNLTYTDSSDTEKAARDKLAVSMQVGDFNGDNLDDLAVLSYSHDRNSKGNTAYYSPQLKICYGSSAVGTLCGRAADTVLSAASQSGSTLTFPVGTSLAAGDYNGDGCDDLYAVGVKATATAGNSISSIDVSGDTWYLHRFNGVLGGKMIDAGYTTISSNAWFEDGFYASDEYYGKTLAVGVAFSGNAAPESLFIAGSIYDVSSGTPVHKLTGSYFKSGDQGLGGVTATNTFMQSVQVGNFDNNAAGREQAAFIVGMKESGADDYWFEAGMVCGTNFADTVYDDNSTRYGVAQGYECTDLDAAEYIHKNKGDDPKEGLNCFFVALDYDDDSLQAKYRGVKYIYTDPTVNVVLQAAPYFGDITTSGLNTTGYTVQTDYTTSSSDSNNLSASVGFAASGSVPFAETTSAAAGLQGGFSAVHTSSVTTSYAETFEAGGHDVVVTSRTPILIYQYDVLTNGSWTGKTQMEFTVPEGPVYRLMQLEEYNEFVQAYNAMMQKEGATDYHKLQPIDAAANWMDGNEGNPYAYNQSGWANKEIDATQVNKGNGYALGTTGGRTVVSLSEGTADEESFTAEFGFYVQVSVLFGPKAIANYGFELAGEYTHGWGMATTTADISASSFAVQDLDGDALLASGMEEDMLARYGFNWTCGTWKRDLGMMNANGKSVKTLFLGYSLRDISSPPVAVTELSAEALRDGTVALSWTKPSTPDGWPSTDGYTVFRQITNADGTVTYEELLSVDSGDATSAVLKTLTPHETYALAIRSKHASTNGIVYGALSNVVTVDVLEKIVTESIVTFSDTVRDAQNAVIGNVRAEVQGTAISSGAVVSAPVTFTATPQDGYIVTSWVVTADGQTQTYPVDDERVFTVGLIGDTVDVKATFVLASSLVETVRVIRPSEGGKIRMYKADGMELVPDGGGYFTVHYNTPVTFVAEPQTGYVLDAWTEDGAGQTELSFTVNVRRDITVGAVFKAPVKYPVYYTPTDANGNTVTATPNVQNGGTVAAGTEVTFKATAADGYYIEKWTITKGGVATDYVVDDVCTQATQTVIVDAAATVEVSFVTSAPILGQKPIERPDESPSSPQTGETTSSLAVLLAVILSAGSVFLIERFARQRLSKR